MPTVLLILVSGAIAGYFLRRKPFVSRQVGKAIGIAIMLLLFFLGVSVGANPDVIAKFRSIGTEALLIALGGTSGSVMGGWMVYRWFFNGKNKPE